MLSQKDYVWVYSCNPKSQSWEAVTSAQWVTAMIDTAGPSDTIAAPVAQLFIIHTGLVPRLLCFLFSSPTPPSRLISQKKKTTSTRLPSRVRWKSGSAWKWHHQAKEMNSVKERNSVRGREYSEHSEVLCYSHVRLSASTLHSSTRDGPAIPSQLSPAACLLPSRVMRWWCHWL